MTCSKVPWLRLLILSCVLPLAVPELAAETTRTIHAVTIVSPTAFLGVNTTTPSMTLDVQDPATSRVASTGYGTTGLGAFISRSARGTMASPTATQSGDTFGAFDSRGYGATGFAPSSSIKMHAVATQNWTDAAQGAAIAFLTTPNGSAGSAATEAMRIDNNARVGIGTTAPAATLSVGSTNGFTVNGSGNPTTVNGIVTSFPAAQGLAQTVLRNDGAGALTWVASGSGSSFITSGTTFTTPATISTATNYRFTLIGGGGGGGGINTANGHGTGGGGAGVCTVIRTGLTPSTAYTIAIGAAGTGGDATPNAGTAGGNTTLTIGATTYTAAGGGGGFATNSTTVGGAGGTTTNCTIPITGQNGFGSTAAGTQSPLPSGGNSGRGWGLGGVGSLSFVGLDGFAGTGFGGGGAGAGPGPGIGGGGSPGGIFVEYSN